ncbi:MFS transporter [Evansella sp. LMS18]|jgi:CP family cyanate transporter-like MFS transporter|uniref:CynX/NimT family MFS transporter n=1 Tax=Evansella sp. LMS18 TaxID=2924033 RepID=UPI0020D0A6F5|nr:MFS transporter [Evansella sp. LMS18]UTR12044.1 MFS transporter [Evansella sp. LMS18]
METQPLTKDRSIETNKVLLIIGILIVAVNLRPAITAVGPLISDIRTDMGITNGVAGIITTLPLLAFGVFSLAAPRLGYRFGNEMMIFAGLFTLLFGIIVRSTGFTATLFLGTAFVGIGIAIANVLLPSIVKTKYPGKIGLITGAYTTTMSAFAAIGTGVSIPLATGLNLGWEGALLFWSGLAVIGLVLWFPQVREARSAKEKADAAGKNKSKLPVPGTTIWRSSLAWQVTLFMGLQSFLFYGLITWLPVILHNSGGLPLSFSAWVVSIMQIAGLPMTFLTPILATRLKNQQGIVTMIAGLYVIGFIGLLVSEATWLFVVSAILIGLAQGSSISLALTMLGIRAANGKQAAELSGMAQSVGYGLAAVGPIIIGSILDITASGTIAVYVFIGVAVLKLFAGLGAARDRTV